MPRSGSGSCRGRWRAPSSAAASAARQDGAVRARRCRRSADPGALRVAPLAPGPAALGHRGRRSAGGCADPLGLRLPLPLPAASPSPAAAAGGRRAPATRPGASRASAGPAAPRPADGPRASLRPRTGPGRPLPGGVWRGAAAWARPRVEAPRSWA